MELRAQEHHTVGLISEYPMKSEQMFAETMEALKAKETVQA